MRIVWKWFWWGVFSLGLLAVANGVEADVLEHSGAILEDTLWGSGDEHVIRAPRKIHFLKVALFIYQSISIAQSSKKAIFQGAHNRDVTVYSQVTQTIEAGAAVRVIASSDDTAGENDLQCSEPIVNGSLVTNGPVTLPGLCTPDPATPVSGDRRGIRLMLTLPRASQFSINYDCGIAHRPLSVCC